VSKSRHDYKKYLNELINARPHRGRGVRSEIAKATKTQNAYVSQVLNGSVHFSPEQAEALNYYLDHSQMEGRFFLLLVQKARAGTRALQTRLAEILESRLNLKKRLDVRKSLSNQDQVIYYSAWYFSAIHVLLSIAEYQTKDSIAGYLDLPLKRVNTALEFLTSVGLAREESGRFKIGETRIHLGNDSPMIIKHHMNWRLQAVRSLESEVEKDLRYSSIATMSRADAGRIKSMLIKAIEELEPVINPSPEEAVYCTCLDFFSVGKD